jgi:acyl-CoA thioester hydrolase
MKTDFRFHHRLRVRFAETDLQGFVFNGNYLTYYDVAWTEYFRAIGLEYKYMVAMGADTVLARTTLEFKRPARFDEILEIYTRVSKIGRTSLSFEFEIYAEGEDRLGGTASSVYVCIETQTLRPTRVPDEMRSRIGRFEEKEFS